MTLSYDLKNYADRGEHYPPRLITAFVISTILHIIRKPNEISVLLSIQTFFKDCFETRAYLPPHRLSSRLISSFLGTLSGYNCVEGVWKGRGFGHTRWVSSQTSYLPLPFRTPVTRARYKQIFFLASNTDPTSNIFAYSCISSAQFWSEIQLFRVNAFFIFVQHWPSSLLSRQICHRSTSFPSKYTESPAVFAFLSCALDELWRERRGQRKKGVCKNSDRHLKLGKLEPARNPNKDNQVPYISLSFTDSL